MKIVIAIMAITLGLSSAYTVGGGYGGYAGGFVEPAYNWGSSVGVVDDWRFTNDWNRDGVIDWRDDFYLSGERPWTGDWLRADWNRDGVIDYSDGWRRFDNTWGVAPVNGVLPANSWRAEGAVVREVPATGFVDDWRHIDGPWGVPEWGYGLSGWDTFNGYNGLNGWNTHPAVYGGEAFVDDWAWRDGWRGAAPVTARPATTTKATTTTAKPTTKATTTTKPATTKAATTTTAKPVGK